MGHIHLVQASSVELEHLLEGQHKVLQDDWRRRFEEGATEAVRARGTVGRQVGNRSQDLLRGEGFVELREVQGG
jgi:uncharacterized cupin superfamily protein